MNLTEKDRATLEQCRTAGEWRKACDNLKEARGGQYPADWGTWAFQEGNLDRITGRWRSPGIRAIPVPVRDVPTMKTRNVSHITLGDFVEFLARTYNVRPSSLAPQLYDLAKTPLRFHVRVEPYPYEVGSAKEEIISLCAGGSCDLRVVMNDLCANGIVAPGEYLVDRLF